MLLALTPVAALAADPAATNGSTGSPLLSTPAADGATAASSTPVRTRSRVVSADLAAQLAAATPKYTPPPPKPPAPDEDEATDLRDVDKPRNGIIRLPKYIVTQPRPPVLSERAVYTKSGLNDLAIKRYLSEGYRVLNGFTLPLFGTSAGARAMQMYDEDERLKNMSALNEDARMVSASDKAAGLYVKRQVQETYMHAPDFDWKPMGR